MCASRKPLKRFPGSLSPLVHTQLKQVLMRRGPAAVLRQLARRLRSEMLPFNRSPLAITAAANDPGQGASVSARRVLTQNAAARLGKTRLRSPAPFQRGGETGALMAFKILDSARSSAIISLNQIICVCEQVTNGVSSSRLGHIGGEFVRAGRPNFHILRHQLSGQCECRGPEHRRRCRQRTLNVH